MAVAIETDSREEYLSLQAQVREMFADPLGGWPEPRWPDPLSERLEPLEFIRRLAQVQLERDEQVRHPFSRKLVLGQLSPVELKAWVKVNYPHLVQTLRNDAMIVAKAKDVPEMRKQMHVLIEEAGSDLAGGRTTAHPILWIEFGQELGLTEQEIVQAPLHPFTSVFIDSMILQGLMRPIGGVPFNLRTGERAKSVIFPVWREALAKHYGLSDWALLFFDEHGEADWGHGTIGEEVLLTRCGTLEQQREIWEAGRRSLARQYAKFDIWEIAIRWHIETIKSTS
ncbi:MAG TPA: iron-containing redox enzyme family protein [Chloroflexota bacterium]|nr:iron-containing redox enzyme family protein [Chloroflexota bacterium]